MPKVGNYRANSVIYFQGDVVSDKVYVLQQGKVSLNYTDIETSKEIREIIQTGKFSSGSRAPWGSILARRTPSSSPTPRSSSSRFPSSRCSRRPRRASS